ncbi:lysophospholipase L1-like esterase [Brachybacterium faecium DSM 4810]|uniref:Lysophospholipase L1-like esterase n=1 Tax=Brachybacterium faecium (strain ATCC 43885 / DSM 4810 / JCM 11609 / LMG 19847 / NBRC 14762 / NCIMB 9860 / 6-10) TaxID=446465 RepID=C7MDW0_BRAFD|nr:SGNH/GDSL hydrolase family protein [Brachybacterium faecium]ACU85767.1 lysophospholipase L1-like esterase [Brachybacterium faecium DSM 4810]HJG52499.1 SGNH/GDSL hydrolase family protein [Brachybacterium faecium]
MTTTSARAPRTLLFIGDSITDAGRREDPEQLGHGYVRLLAEHFAAHEPTATVINRGISGDKVADLEARFGPDCLDLAPDLVTVYVGVNDSWHRFTRGEHVPDEAFEQGYRHLLDQLAARVPSAPVAMILPFVADIDEQAARIHTDLDGKVAIIRRLAAEGGHRLVDLEEVLERALAAGHAPEHVAADGVHPTPAGHRLIADAWLDAVGR